MRILQISSAPTFGGGEKHVCDLAAGLAGLGHEISLAVRPGCGWKDKIRGVEPANIHEVPLRGSADIGSAFRLASLTREHEFDILHAHMARDYVPAAIASRRAGVPVVLTRHVLFPMSGINKLLLRNVGRVIAVSSAVEANLQAIFEKEKIFAVTNGIAMEKFGNVSGEDASAFRDVYGIDSGVKLVTSVGELKALKGQEDFILAASEIAKVRPDAHFLVVGRDNSPGRAFRKKLRRMVRVLDLEGRFTFLEWVEDTAPMLAATDVFVSASHSESFGLAILEAMASGRPVVATRTAGALELIEDGVSGLLAGVKEPLEISKAVVDILDDGDQAHQLGTAARSRAADNFSLAKMVASTESVYEELARPEAGSTAKLRT